jgi:hypothetical protein
LRSRESRKLSAAAETEAEADAFPSEKIIPQAEIESEEEIADIADVAYEAQA